MSIIGAQTFSAPRFDEEAKSYDAILVLSFGGAEGPVDVLRFLVYVTGGRNIPRERLLEVSEHYLHFGGVSPINAQNRALIEALRTELDAHALRLPIYFGNRNWEPYVTDTIRQMRAEGVKRALVFVTSALSSYSGCRQYREDVMRAIESLGHEAPTFDKLRVFYNHPGFIEPMAESTRDSLESISPERRSTTRLIFTAHSIPTSMARQCAYEVQLAEASRLIAEAVAHPDHTISYQSRSGSPHTPWLEPDILDSLRQVKLEGATDVVIVPVGFISDHMEVLFDLDTEARDLAAYLGLGFARVPTVGTHPRFVAMIRELIQERMESNPARAALGGRGSSHDICPLNCCLIGSTRPSSTVS